MNMAHISQTQQAYKNDNPNLEPIANDSENFLQKCARR